MHVRRLTIGDTAPPLAADEVHVWLAPLDRPDDESQLHPSLNADEQRRADRYKIARVRRQFVVGRGLLRRSIGHYLRIVPSTIAFEYGPTGKPFVAGTDLMFNLSHTDGYAILAFAWGKRLGVDIEPVREVENMAGLIARFYTSAEHAAFLAMPDAMKPAAFFRGWTCKEAILKGLGLSVQALDRFEVELDPTKPPRVVQFEAGLGTPSEWTLLAWEPCEGHAAALAVETGK